MPARSGALALRKAIWIVFALCLGVEAGELLRQQAQRLGAPKLASRVLDGLAWYWLTCLRLVAFNGLSQKFLSNRQVHF